VEGDSSDLRPPLFLDKDLWSKGLRLGLDVLGFC
jgi:hypothetical protein